MYKALTLQVVQGTQFYAPPKGEEDHSHASVEQAAIHLVETHGVKPNFGHAMVTDMEGHCVVLV